MAADWQSSRSVDRVREVNERMPNGDRDCAFVAPLPRMAIRVLLDSTSIGSEDSNLGAVRSLRGNHMRLVRVNDRQNTLELARQYLRTDPVMARLIK